MDQFVWVEKYRPKTVQECILPKDLLDTFQNFVNNKNIPNLLLCGGAGVGKTTIAKAMLEEIGCDYMMINGSLEGRNIDILRTTIKDFASSMSFVGGRKYIIMDEADYINASSTQPALRNFIEEYSSNCGFVFTCNYKNKIIEPLKSRCSVIDFNIPSENKPEIALKFMKRVCNILDAENIIYDKKVVAELINKHFPDWRRVLNELQRYSSNGTIDTGIFVNLEESNLKALVKMLKEKNFKEMRGWVADNIHNDAVGIYRALYDNAYQYVKPSDIPNLVIIIGDYMYKSAFVADQEINMVAALTQIMMDVEFK
jgi:DNA polymerase III delta prime subunit